MSAKIQQGIFRTHVEERHTAGNRMRAFYFSSLIIAFLALIALLANVLNRSYGLVMVDFAVYPEEIAGEGRALTDLTNEELGDAIVVYVGGQTLNLVYDNLSDLPALGDMRGVPLELALREDVIIPEEYAGQPIDALDESQRAELLAINLSQDEMIGIVEDLIVKTDVIESWDLNVSLLDRASVNTFVEEQGLDPDTNLEWRSWLNLNLLNSGISTTDAAETGIRPALLGSIWIMLMVMLISFPVGVGAGIYLQEYADNSLPNRIIATNIRNLAGVPSIIYGMLGLAIFVRALGDLTSGQVFGTGSENGRTIISASLTLSLLILPIIIIQTTEALKAVPFSYREGSYGLGATKWQTISRQVLPAAIPGIMTGTIVALARAIGETAPLIVVGASAFISTDPDGPFSKFTALPIMIYNWTSHPDSKFQNAAAAVIIVLLVLLLAMNSLAVFIRNRASRRLGT